MVYETGWINCVLTPKSPMGKLFLTGVSVLYAGLSIWCIVSPQATSTKVGLQRTAGQGESEFLVIYGGLQMALAITFALPLLRGFEVSEVLLICVIVHVCLAVFRAASFFAFSGFSPMTYQLAIAEWLLLMLSAALLRYETPT